MLIDCGQAYTITVENLTVASSPSSYDLLQIATSSAVPILVTRIVATAAQTAASIQRIQVLRRSTAGTGGTSVSVLATNGGSSTASTTANYLLVSSTGSAGNSMDSQQWNEFAPYEFNQKPAGILVPVSSYLSLFLPAAPASTYSASFTVELVELK